MDIKEEADCSYDEEIFFGRLTLKEVKKCIFMDFHERNMPVNNLARCKKEKVCGKDLNYNNDFKIIEQSSQPNVVSHSCKEEITIENLKSSSDPCFNRNKQNAQIKMTSNKDHESQDSFLEIEKNVTEQSCINNNLDNTLEFVDFILNHAQSHIKDKKIPIKKEESCEDPKGKILSIKKLDKEDDKIERRMLNTEVTPAHVKYKQFESLPTPSDVKIDVAGTLKTPISNKKEVSNFFRTPKIPQSQKKGTCSKKTPSRSKAYEHIPSPIATYIRKSPQVSLEKHVHSKKHLPSTSLIPKPLKNAPENKCDKENVKVPALAYQSAKKTLVIDVNKEKVPPSNWAQKLTILSQKPVVLKHDHREADRRPLLLKQENSFQDLTLHQADVSICTQKLAFNKL